MVFMGLVGGFAGLMFASQNAGMRLMGFRDNRQEVESLVFRLDQKNTKIVQ
jgi:hypothetical protein